jgi:hypothetical protein
MWMCFSGSVCRRAGLQDCRSCCTIAMALDDRCRPPVLAQGNIPDPSASRHPLGTRTGSRVRHVLVRVPGRTEVCCPCSVTGCGHGMISLPPDTKTSWCVVPAARNSLIYPPSAWMAGPDGPGGESEPPDRPGTGMRVLTDTSAHPGWDGHSDQDVGGCSSYIRKIGTVMGTNHAVTDENNLYRERSDRPLNG